MYKNLKYIFNNKLYINVFLIIKKKKKKKNTYRLQEKIEIINVI